MNNQKNTKLFTYHPADIPSPLIFHAQKKLVSFFSLFPQQNKAAYHSYSNSNHFSLPEKLIINSTPDKIVFDENNLAVLILPKISYELELLRIYNIKRKYTEFRRDSFKILLSLEPGHYKIYTWVYINNGRYIKQAYTYDFNSYTSLNLNYASFGYIRCITSSLLIQQNMKLSYFQAKTIYNKGRLELCKAIENLENLEFNKNKDILLIIRKLNGTQSDPFSPDTINKTTSYKTGTGFSSNSGFNTNKSSSFSKSTKHYFSTLGRKQNLSINEKNKGTEKDKSNQKQKLGFIYRNPNSLWHTYFSNTHYQEINLEVLEKELTYFLKLYKSEFKQKFLAVMFKIKFDNGDIRSASTVQIASTEKKHFNKLYWSLASIFKHREINVIVSEPEEIEFFAPISGLPVGNILFSFKPMGKINQTKYEEVSRIDELKLLANDDQSKKNPLYNFKFNGYTIPSTMDLSLWPNINFINEYKSAIASIEIKSGIKNIPLFFMINIDDFSTTTSVLLNNQLIFTIKDESLNNNKDLSTFKRTIFEKNKNKIFYFELGELVFYTEKIDVNYIKTIKKDVLNFEKPKILTLDLETRAIKNIKENRNEKTFLKLIPILMSIYNGKNFENFLFTHSNWEEEMMQAFQSIMKRKYDGYTVYTHNFSHFDSIFIIDILSRLGKVKPFMRDGKILRLTFKFKSPNSTRLHTLYFMDSLLMLPNSLDKLSKSFNIENKKSIFPHSFLDDPKIGLDYQGECPDYKFFPKAHTNEFKYEEYLKYANIFKNTKWVLKDEIIKYCENDTLALYQILMKFREYIYMKFKIDFSKYPTIPSLSFAIYRSNFMKDGIIPIIQSKLHRIIKQSYYGGITENYKSRGRNIKSYDVNSLYPHSMKTYPMPTGQPVYVKGDLKYIIDFFSSGRRMAGVTTQASNKKCFNEIPFGFYNVNVVAPELLDKPFLPTKIKSSNGLRTIFPLGQWSGWYFSEEIVNAMKYGYKFEFKEGYLFNKTYLFEEYIDILYDIKTNVDKNDPWYYISKLLMNSLYGRFGLNPEGIEVVISTEEEGDEIIQTQKNVNITPLLSKNVLISYQKSEDSFTNMNISVPISSAISAYSRVTMSHFIVKYSKNLYYIDTDGIKIDTNLMENEVDNKELGKMKYEYKFSEFIGIGPKAYGGIIENNHNNPSSELVKLKGYNSILPLRSLKEVLNRDNKIELQQSKWMRKLSQSTILVSEDSYTLSLTEGKRELIFNPWGDLVGTIPFKLKNNKIELTRKVSSGLMYLKNPILYFV